MSRRKSEIFGNLKHFKITMISRFREYYNQQVMVFQSPWEQHSHSCDRIWIISCSRVGCAESDLTGSNDAKDLNCWNKSYGEEGRRLSSMTLSQFEELKKTVGKDPTAPPEPHRCRLWRWWIHVAPEIKITFLEISRFSFENPEYIFQSRQPILTLSRWNWRIIESRSAGSCSRLISMTSRRWRWFEKLRRNITFTRFQLTCISVRFGFEILDEFWGSQTF